MKLLQGKTSLKHFHTHTGEKPYKCIDCNKTFAREDNLENHLQTHTGEKPFTCIECNETFATSYCFSRHVLTHTGEKPYQCIECDKGFFYIKVKFLDIYSHTLEKKCKFNKTVRDTLFYIQYMFIIFPTFSINFPTFLHIL